MIGRMAPPSRVFEKSEDLQKIEFVEVNEDKLVKKMWETPFIPIGVGGALGMLLYAAATFRKRGQMSTSIFLMHLRVKAQSMIVGSIAIGVTAMMIQEYLPKSKRSQPD